MRLEHNELRQIDPKPFRNSRKIEQVFLNDNFIEVIPPEQFRGLEKLRRLDLQRNKIRSVGQNAFAELYSIETINLANNHLLTLNQDVGLFNNILKFKLNLSSNQLRCDCGLIWIVEKMRINQLSLAGYCEKPEALKGLPLNEPLLPHLRSCPIEKEKQPSVEELSSNEIITKNVIIGDNAILNCWPISDSVSWYRNSKELEFNSKFHLYSNGSLKIQSMSPKDESVYTCRTGSQVVSYKLKLLDPPLFTSLPNELYELDLGSSLELLCEADGLPKPIISWINKSLNRNLTSGNRLKFLNVTSSIDANYQCIASNGVGYAIHEFTINVRGGELEERNYRSNQGFGSRSSGVNELFTDEDVKEAVEQDREAVNQAIERTREYILAEHQVEFPLIEYKDQSYFSTEHNISFNYIRKSSNKKKFSPSKLMKIARFPLDQTTIESAKSIEIYEKAIELLKRKAETTYEFMTLNFTYNDLLTTNQLTILNTLTGCLLGNRHHNQLKHQSCESRKNFNKCFRTIDGSCNNLENPLYGTALTPFKRLLRPIYEDGLHLPVGWFDNKLYDGYKKPSPRKVTLELLSSINLKEDNRNTHMLAMFGQFIDHDLSFSMPSISLSTFDRVSSVDCQTTCTKTPPCYSIPLEPNDPRQRRPHLLKNRNTTYANCIELVRSSSFCGSGLSSVGLGVLMPREQVNQITSYLDLSQVYGSNPQLALDLKEIKKGNGRLRTSLFEKKQYLPLNEKKQWPNDCRQDPSKSDFECFLAGDIRSNEQLALTALHTLFLREHNRIADELKTLNGHWSDNRIYNEARNILVAKMQHITYDHWLLHVLGPNKQLKEYEGYNQSENASISNVFATAAFRFGHTLVQPFLSRLNETYQPHTKYKSKLDLHEVFFSPHLLLDGGIDPVLRGLIHSSMKSPEPHSVINDQLTENLFELSRHVSLDLASINIQRAREHGLPGYNEWRKFCGLSHANTFHDLRNEIKNGTIRYRLRKLYGSPSNLDLWVGCVLEDRLENATVGPTFACLIREQFARTRSGDRLWYENLFTSEKLLEIKRSSLAELICLNTDIDQVTSDVFLLPKHQEFVKCSDLAKSDLSAWRESESKHKMCN